MKRASIRDLHLKTGAILKKVADGEVYVIERNGVPVAELRPVAEIKRPTLPDREEFIASMPMCLDSGRILEEDRS